MPQLNPAPWFSIFMLTWILLLIIMPPKILNSTPTIQATNNLAPSSYTTNWSWPWL